MLRDLPFGRQNDNKKWRCRAERSEASRYVSHDILAEIPPACGCQNDKNKWRCHAEGSEASRLIAHDASIKKQGIAFTVLLLILGRYYVRAISYFLKNIYSSVQEYQLSLKSFHSGFMDSIKAIFFFLSQPLISFSRDIALCMSNPDSKYTSFLML